MLKPALLTRRFGLIHRPLESTQNTREIGLISVLNEPAGHVLEDNWRPQLAGALMSQRSKRLVQDQLSNSGPTSQRSATPQIG